MRSFEQFVKEQDDIADMEIQSGSQMDPDKPQEVRTKDLINTLKDIIELSKKAITANKDFSQRIEKEKPQYSRPLADNPGALFGME